MPHTTRYSPELIPSPVNGSGMRYACPCCGVLLRQFRLRTDHNGTQRLVDVTGMPCDECLNRHYCADVDDGK